MESASPAGFTLFVVFSSEVPDPDFRERLSLPIAFSLRRPTPTDEPLFLLPTPAFAVVARIPADAPNIRRIRRCDLTGNPLSLSMQNVANRS